jgi:transcriptional regulator with XRE-family HTH domain
MAELIGTSRRHMIRIENGQHRPGPDFIERIARHTEQPESFFEDGDDEDEEAALRSMAESLVAVLIDAARKHNDAAKARRKMRA